MFEVRPMNAEKPPAIPARPMGRIPVIVRLEYPDGAVYRPGRANRWTSTHVLVLLTSDERGGAETMEWLPAADVHRSLPAPASSGGALRGGGGGADEPGGVDGSA